MTPTEPEGPVVRVHELVKERGGRRVLDRVTFTIPRGCAFGLIGPNGAGKTTVIKILLGMLKPGAGEVEVLGAAPMDLPPALRQRIGYLSERSGATDLPDLPIAELLQYQSHFFTTWNWAGWRGLMHRRETESVANSAFLASSTAIGICLFVTPGLWGAVLAFAVGLAGVLLRLRGLDEAQLADCMRREEELSREAS